MIDALLFIAEGDERRKPDFKKDGLSYWIIGPRKYTQYSVKVKSQFPNTLIKQNITKTVEDKKEWGQIINNMLTDDECKAYYGMMESYVDAVYVESVGRIKKRRSSYNPLDENLRYATKQSILYIYILKLVLI